nr:integrase, catalytic region, zinc finger, CCHC-type, peptidase aspartic, catalytic [Tanacetum cinerariifolium]
MRIPLLYRDEYSQWSERFMNYLEEQTDGEAMINSIKTGDQSLPRVTQVSIAGTSSTEQPPLKDKSMWSDQEKKIQKIDRLARSFLIQGLPNDIYSLIDNNKTAKDLWNALARHMLSSEYGEQDRKDAVLYEYETFKATEGELLLDTYIRYLQKEDKKVDEKKRDISKVKCYYCKKEGNFVKDCKKAKVKDYNYYKTKMLLAKKDSDEQVLLAEDQAWMESNSDSDKEINVNMVFMAQIKKQMSSLKPYVPTMVLEKIIIDLEDKVVSLLEKEMENLKIIESLKSKGFESSENAISESKNQSKNDCQVIEKGCDQVENSNVIAPGMFKLSVSQSVSPISVTKTSCASNSVETNAFDCNNARNALCNARMNASIDVNDLFVFDDVSIRKSHVSKMSFRKKPSASLNVPYMSKLNKSLPKNMRKWLPKLQPLAEPVAKWIPKVKRCSKHMTGNRTLLTNFVEKFFETVRFGNNDFAVIVGYGDVVIRSMTIKRVYYVEVLGHNLFNVGQFYDKGLEVAFRKSTCFVQTESSVDLLTGDCSSNLYTIALNEIASNSSACLLAKASSS